MVAGVLALLQFGEHILHRVVGEKRGILLSGFLGGLASSTAVYMNLGVLQKAHPGLARPMMGAALLATLASLLEMLILVAVIARRSSERDFGLSAFPSWSLFSS